MKKINQIYKDMPLQVKASFWFAVCNILQKGVQFITLPVFTRLLTAGQFGQYSIYTTWIGVLGIVTSLQLFSGVFNNGMMRYENDRAGFISSLQGLASVCCIAVYVVYLAGCRFWNDLIGLPGFVIQMMFLELFMMPALEFWMQRQRYEFRYKGIVIVTIVVTAVNPLIGIAAVLSGPEKGIRKTVAASFVNMIFGCMFYLFNIQKGKKLFVKEYWKYALKFNLPLVPHYLSAIILNSADRVMMQNMFGEREVGIYSLAYSLAGGMQVVMNAVSAAYSPWTYQKLKNREYAAFRRATTRLLMGMAAAALLPAVLSPEIISIMAPAAYDEAVYVMPPVTTSIFFIFLYGLFANIEFFHEKTRFVTAASVLAASVNIVLNYIFMPVFGYVAAGYTTMACYMLLAVFHCLCYRKICRENMGGVMPYNLKHFWGIAAAYLLCTFLFMMLYDCLAVRYVLAAVMVMAIIYKEIRKKG